MNRIKYAHFKIVEAGVTERGKKLYRIVNTRSGNRSGAYSLARIRRIFKTLPQ